MAEQGPPPSRHGRLPTAGHRDDYHPPGRRRWEEPGSTEEEYPPWAGPGVTPRWADQDARRHRAHARPDAESRIEYAAPEDGPRPGQARRGSRSRKAAARSRRRSRITWVWGGAAAAVALIVAGLVFLMGGNGPAPSSAPGFVTTFQAGELKTVPSACTAVTTATLSQYLPGTRRVVAPHSLDGSAQSLCNWTLDAPPVYRVLEVNLQAYAPSGLASGDGSATFAAIDAYQQAMQSKRHPLRATHLPAATVTALHGLGTVAFAALQVVRTRGDATDLETVVARDHNVVITVVMQGPHARNGRYHAAPQSQLQSGAIAAATDIVSALR